MSGAKVPFFALLIFLLTALSCAPHQVPARGDPIRVGQVKNEELSLREIPLERYIAGVLEKEVRADWPLEALKAQAVAARTYALYRKSKPRDSQFDVLSDTTDQVFESDENHAPSIVRAVLETEGQTLQSKGRVFEAFFHSCCGGTSESADAVWPGNHPAPLVEVHEDPYCSACPPAHWKYRVSLKDFEKRLEQSDRPSTGWSGVVVSERDASGRVESATLTSTSRKSLPLSGIELRKILGNTNVKSTLFDITENGDDLVFEGRGSGHGVGMCQWGAKGMAEHGKSYREILEFYYPGADIVSLSAEAPAAPAVSSQDKIIEDLERPK
ncbi:MAG TPA: SpoIID/LytB domain-containing protein [bacterium]|nr:SpoIID/LytB domain-containing protein [bacterium]